MAAIPPRQLWINRILSLQVERAPQEQIKQESESYFATAQHWRFEDTFPQKIELIANVVELARNCILLVKAIVLDPNKVTVVVENNTKTEAERKAEREESRQNRALILGAAVFLGALGFTGYHLKSFKRQNKIYNSSQQILSEAKQLPKSPMKIQIIRLFDLQRKLETLRTFKERGYAVTVLGFALSAGSLLAYGFGGVMKAQKIGYFGLIASAAIGILNCTYHWKDARKIESLQTEILGSYYNKGLADGILEQLRPDYYQENMEPVASNAPASASAPLAPLRSAALSSLLPSAPRTSKDELSPYPSSPLVPIPIPSAPPLVYPILTTYNANAEPPPSFLSPLSEEVDF